MLNTDALFLNCHLISTSAKVLKKMLVHNGHEERPLRKKLKIDAVNGLKWSRASVPYGDGQGISGVQKQCSSNSSTNG